MRSKGVTGRLWGNFVGADMFEEGGGARHLGHREKRAGFSLVEVVMAIGIAVFALVGIFALLQNGLATYRNAMNSTISASISQQVLSQYLLADFDKLSALPPQTSYYDERGLPLSDGLSNSIYTCVANVLPNPILGVDVDNLLAVHIVVSSPTQPQFRKEFTSWIARQGKDNP